MKTPKRRKPRPVNKTKTITKLDGRRVTKTKTRKDGVTTRKKTITDNVDKKPFYTKTITRSKGKRDSEMNFDGTYLRERKTTSRSKGKRIMEYESNDNRGVRQVAFKARKKGVGKVKYKSVTGYPGSANTLNIKTKRAKKKTSTKNKKK